MLNILLYIACVLIWGTTWYAITMQLGVVAPEVSLTYRFGGATLILLIYSLSTRRPLRISLADHGFAVLLGICMFSLNYALTYYGAQYISSGLVAVLFTVLTFMNLANEMRLAALCCCSCWPSELFRAISKSSLGQFQRAS